MQHLCWCILLWARPFGSVSPACQARVRFFALRRIKPHAPPLVRAPVNSFEFQPCGRTPQAGYLMVSLRHRTRTGPTPSTHRLGRGLPGYLILFATHAFAPQRQSRPRRPSSPQAFLQLVAGSFLRDPLAGQQRIRVALVAGLNPTPHGTS